MAFQIAVLSSLLPALILSGFIFPIQNMPLPIQGISYVVIPRYFVGALRGIILKDASLIQTLPNLLGLLVLGIIFNLIAAWRTRKTV